MAAAIDWNGDGRVLSDSILIKDLEIRAFHGVLPEEKVLGQKFLITLEMGLDLHPAGCTDDLAATVNYAEVARDVTHLFGTARYALIETGAESVARHVLVKWPLIRSVRVTVKKPWAPIRLPLDTVSVTVCRSWHRAFVAIGSNLGDREATFRSALESLKSEVTCLKRISSFHETKPVGFTDQPIFLNGALELETLMTPYELLNLLQKTEDAHGRTRSVHWGPRTLDLDLLLYDDFISEKADLLIPHPRMMDRKFVLQPLCEIAPWVVHPLTRQRMADALADLESDPLCSSKA
jgi:dihydroneopterin aldolase / 2-amino-4-hydroxy-6-hydroxymethyldihydropteridine diphosphokinase